MKKNSFLELDRISNIQAHTINSINNYGGLNFINSVTDDRCAYSPQTP